jgi:hypothetical protein
MYGSQERQGVTSSETGGGWRKIDERVPGVEIKTVI